MVPLHTEILFMMKLKPNPSVYTVTGFEEPLVLSIELLAKSQDQNTDWQHISTTEEAHRKLICEQVCCFD
jgi:hypothetical protein